MKEYKLILHPKDPRAEPPATEPLTTRLAAWGLTGNPFAFRGREHYLVGEQFMQLITFLGCSPAVAFEPPADGSERDGADFCHLELRGPFPTTRFLGEGGVKRPRCPRCRGWIDDWEHALSRWREGETHLHPCPRCGEAIDPTTFKWRHSAGFGRLAIAIWGVFEGEAVPSETLLRLLRESSGGEWDYFYSRAV